MRWLPSLPLRRLLARLSRRAPGQTDEALARALSTLADGYQRDHDYAQAIALFGDAVPAAQLPATLAYAHASLCRCYLDTHRIAQAITECQAVRAVPDCPPGLAQWSVQESPQLESLLHPHAGAPKAALGR